jgi:hypothetical protein
MHPKRCEKSMCAAYLSNPQARDAALRHQKNIDIILASAAASDPPRFSSRKWLAVN